MTICRTALIGLACFVGAAASANAADMYSGDVSMKDDGYVSDAGRSWYLRSFMGFSNYDSDAPTTELQDDTFTFLSHDYESAGFLGAGIGIERNQWLRFEGTVEYRGNATLHGLDSYNDGVCAAVGDCGTNEYTAVVESWAAMASAYFDICTVRGITPYVGAGIGFANVSVNGMTDTNVPAASVFFGEDHSETNLAWSLSAGLAYDVSDSFTVDFGYRYLDLGDARSGTMTAYDLSSTYASVDLDNLRSHDLMVGMRWKLDRSVDHTPMK